MRLAERFETFKGFGYRSNTGHLRYVAARHAVASFVGALHGNRANQGVFITTARFSSGARQYGESVATRVVLIDGQRLERLMMATKWCNAGG